MLRIEPFGVLPTGEGVLLATLANSRGSSLSATNYGGIVTALRVPDRHGVIADVVLGFDRFDAYLGPHPYFGAIAGRVAGRIPGGYLVIDGQSWQLPLNDGPNHLHGGIRGLDKRLWRMDTMDRVDGAPSVRLSYSSPHGEEGYPGNVDIAVTYTLTDANEFIIDTEAASDRPTPLSLTHHSYFNLAGEGSGDALDHELTIHADHAIDADAAMTPLGTASPVAGRAHDFNRARRLRDVMPGLFQQHGDLYQIRGGNTGTLVPAARLHDPVSGRLLTVSTTMAMLQFYSGASLDDSLLGKSDNTYGRHTGVCLECEGYPDAVAHPEFGDILVRPGTPQRHRTVYAFSTT
ncbi:MAG: galactose mutarotase [Verrucomicrobiaceae bacterium]|nr:MAG: galactose mutarotase [Verrucomicrobiaceae bacterium]